MVSSQEAFDRVVARERSYHRGRRFRHARGVLRFHARLFVLVNLVLIAIWVGEVAVTDGPHPAWWVPAALGWGAGLGVHALMVHRPWHRRGPKGDA